jgi:transposase
MQRRDRKSKYPPEYRRRMVDLVRAGRTMKSLAAEYGVSYDSIRKWVIDSDRAAAAHTDGIPLADLSELQRLRARVAELEEEREILKKASAWFAQEATRTPPKRSGS